MKLVLRHLRLAGRQGFTLIKLLVVIAIIANYSRIRFPDWMN